jgi:hypothetical protein
MMLCPRRKTSFETTPMTKDNHQILAHPRKSMKVCCSLLFIRGGVVPSQSLLYPFSFS